MNEDYLWDKSGEVDPEIERLERTLASLRYKRPVQPLPLPVVARPSFRFNSTWLAAAAAIALLILAGGLWFALHRSGSNDRRDEMAGSAVPKAVESPKTVSLPPATGSDDSSKNVAESNGSDQSPERTGMRAPRKLSSSRLTIERRQELAEKNRERALREEETIRRGELAKEQLIKALQITSDKLNAVQKKFQGNQEHYPIS